MRNILISTALLVGVSLAGCYTEEQVGVDYGGGGGYAVAGGPSMDYVSPGVQVVADYDYPVFFSDGLYWRWYGGGWYSSRWYDRGWAANYRVPYGIRGISRPGMYAHYHRGGGYIRDHRAYGAPAYRGGGAVRTPSYRAPARTYRPAASTSRRRR